MLRSIRFMTLTLGLLAASSSWHARATPCPAAVATMRWPSYEEVAPEDRSTMLALLGEVGLDPTVLGALNVDREQADVLLLTLRSWVESHAQALAQSTTAVAQARAALRSAERQWRMGGGNGEALLDLEQAKASLQTAVAARRQLFAELFDELAEPLSQSQRVMVNVLNDGRAWSMPLGGLQLTSEQEGAIATAKRALRAALAAAMSSQERAAARSAWETAVSDALTTENEQIVAAYFETVAAAASNVTAAIEQVMPLGNSE